MQNTLFYTGTAGAQNPTLIDVCLDYFSENNKPVSIAALEQLPNRPKAKGKTRIVHTGKRSTLYVHGSFSDVLQSIALAGRKEVAL